MKRTKILILATTALFAFGTAQFLSSCSEDISDEQEQQLTKADILRAKAKEFAKKYNVDMTLNEENIDSLAEVLTVEQMERDFQDFANHPIDTKPIVIERGKTIKPKRLSIRRTAGLTEYINKRFTGEISGKGVYLNGTQYPESNATIKYECGGQVKDIVNADVNVNGYKVENAQLPASFSVCGEEIEYITAGGSVLASSTKYRYTVSLTIDYSKNSGLHVYLFD